MASWKPATRRLAGEWTKLYDDKLDEKITQEFYNRKFKQYSKEKDELTETIKRHSTASTGYLNLGINLYELSQRAKEIYLTAKKKDMLDEQRALIRLVFKKLILDEGKLSWEYSRAFKILSEAVSQTNCSKVENLEGLEKETFEHHEKSDAAGQKDSLSPSHPIWLPRMVGVRTREWVSCYLFDISNLHVFRPRVVF